MTQNRVLFHQEVGGSDVLSKNICKKIPLKNSLLKAPTPSRGDGKTFKLKSPVKFRLSDRLSESA